MSSPESMALLVDLASHCENLSGYFPRIHLAHRTTRVLVASADDVLLGRFLQALTRHYGAFLAAARIEILPPLVLPEVVSSTVAEGAHSCWFLFPAERFDLRSSEFVRWAEFQRHRQLLVATPLYGFRLFHGETVKRFAEPIVKVDDEHVAGRPIPVISLAIEGDPASFGVQGAKGEMTDLLGRVLLRLLAGRHGRWDRMVAAWDEAVAGLLRRRVQTLGRVGNGDFRHPDKALKPVRDLFDLHRTATEAERRIDGAFALARDLDRRVLADLDLRSRIDRVTEWLNDTRLSFDDFLNEGVAFTEEFQFLRARLLKLAERFVRKLKHLDLPQHADVLHGAQRNLERSLTVVMLGAFSSGKSTFVNSLLRIVDDPLPTSGIPETATINILEYAESETVEVEFANAMDLPLLSRARLGMEVGRFSIHKVEIGALIGWLEAKVVDAASAKVEVFVDPDKPPKAAPPRLRLDRDLVRKLKWLLQREHSTEQASKLAKKKVPRRIRNLRFVRQPHLPSGRAEIQKALRRPGVALRVGRVVFRRRIDALQGASIVDTPGTDSAIAHHHTLAHRFLEHRPGSPVLYCFDGTRVGGKADAKNIAFLKELRGEKDRLFFLITKRELCVKGGRGEAEVRGKVENLLYTTGFAGHKAYFIDSIKIRDGVEQPEWTQLVLDIRAFVDRSRTQVLRADADGLLVEPIRQLRRETQEHLHWLDRSNQDRERQKEAVRQRVEEMAEIVKQFGGKADEAQVRLFRFEGVDFDRSVDEVKTELEDVDLGAFMESTRDERTEEIKEIVEGLDPWPQRLKDGLSDSSRYLHGFVANRLSELGVNTSQMTAKGLPAEFVVMQLTDIRAEAKEEVSDRELFRDGFLLKYSFKKGLQGKKNRLSAMIEEERRAATRRVEDHFEEEIAGYYRNILYAQEEALAEQMKNLEGATDKATLETYEKRMDFLDHCLKELRAVVGIG